MAKQSPPPAIQQTPNTAIGS